LILPDGRFDLGKSDLEGGNAQETTTTKTSKQNRNKQTRNKNIACNENFENLWTQGPLTVNCRL